MQARPSSNRSRSSAKFEFESRPSESVDSLPASLATPAAALCLDDTDSDDSVHQFFTMGNSNSNSAVSVKAALHKASPPGYHQATLQSRLLGLDEDNDEDEDELELHGTNSSLDRPIRTRPPSPRCPIAVGSLRPTVSVPAAAALLSTNDGAAVTTQSTAVESHRHGGQLKRPSYSTSSCSSDDDDHRRSGLGGGKLFNVDFAIDNADAAAAAALKRRRVAAPLGDASNLLASDKSDRRAALPNKLARCMSESSDLSRGSTVDHSARIDKAIDSIDSLNLIGNSEQMHSLPTVKSMDYGIRSVTPDTLAKLLAGQYADRVSRYVIVDCRYPFEFDGGHIRGAVNLYRPEVLLEQLLTDGSPPSSSKQMVIVFHCEFSSQRAPRMARLLRQRDREINADNYPQLHYPEIYVLQGGYKAFYEAHNADCEPRGYTKMSDPSYSEQLILFEKLGRAWERQNSRSKHSRLQRLAALH